MEKFTPEEEAYFLAKAEEAERCDELFRWWKIVKNLENFFISKYVIIYRINEKILYLKEFYQVNRIIIEKKLIKLNSLKN